MKYCLWKIYCFWIYFQVALLLLVLALSNGVKVNGERGGRQCGTNPSLKPRPHSVSILEFGAVGDGKTLNTIAFQNAIFYLKSFADKGGAQLYVPPGTWLTQSFNLTSHLTLFLEKGAVIIGSQVFCLLILLFSLAFDCCLLCVYILYRSIDRYRTYHITHFANYLPM